MTSPDASPVQPGEILAQKYRVERVLGVGGMGVVVAATHVDLGDRVALKFLLPSALASADVVARFLREAQAAVKIKSEHVARVSDLGKLPSGAPYIVMEYLDGEDLSVRLRQRGPLTTQEAVGYVLQACEALAEAHALGIVHRDLKPSNLFLTARADGSPSVKVLDFGISKGAPDMGEAQLTKTSAVMGSPLYMSPEQMRSARNVDTRTDIWSLGVLLFELLTGRVPFEAETMPQLCAMILTEQPTPLREALPGAPEGLERILARCFEKDREQRFQSIAELARELQEYGPPEGQISAQRISRVLGETGAISRGSLPSMSAIAPPAHAATGTDFSASQAQLQGVNPRLPRWVFLVGGVGALAMLALGVVVARGTQEQAPAATAAVASSAPPVASSASPEPALPVASASATSSAAPAAPPSAPATAPVVPGGKKNPTSPAGNPPKSGTGVYSNRK